MKSVILALLGYGVLKVLFLKVLAYPWLSRVLLDLSTLLLALWMCRRDTLKLFQNDRGQWAYHVALGFLAYALMLPIIYVSAWANLYLQSLVVGPDMAAPLHFKFLDKSPMTYVSYSLYAVLITPLVQESFFRGYLFQRLNSLWGPYPAIVFSALLFSLFHFSWRWFLSFFILGVFLAYLFYKTRSLSSSLAAHALNNASAILLHSYFG